MPFGRWISPFVIPLLENSCLFMAQYTSSTLGAMVISEILLGNETAGKRPLLIGFATPGSCPKAELTLNSYHIFIFGFICLALE